MISKSEMKKSLATPGKYKPWISPLRFPPHQASLAGDPGFATVEMANLLLPAASDPGAPYLTRCLRQMWETRKLFFDSGSNTEEVLIG